MNQTFRFLVTMAVVCTLQLTGCAPAPHSFPDQAPKKVIMISIDGLRPDFYRDASYDAPNLRALANAGLSVKGMIPVYPSITYPNHASLVTGVSPDRHGVISNTIFDPNLGSSPDWYWAAKYLKVPALWDLARKAGKSVAIVSWPSSTGADVNWLVPEIFFPSGGHKVPDWKITFDLIKDDLRAEILAKAKEPNYTTFDGRDRWMTDAFLEILGAHQPDLALMHLINLDMTQHMTGRASAETHKSVHEVDRLLGLVIKAIDFKTTTLIVVGDHGFVDYTQLINFNALLASQGWIKVGQDGSPLSWKVLAHPGGGQAAIYSKDHRLDAKVLRVLRQNERQNGVELYRVLDRSELQGLHAYPDAIAAVDPVKGYSMGPNYSGSLVTAVGGTKGQHGYLPANPKLYTGFLAAGAGVAPGFMDTTIRTLDVAPTVAKLLGVEMTGVEGVAVPLSTRQP